VVVSSEVAMTHCSKTEVVTMSSSLAVDLSLEGSLSSRASGQLAGTHLWVEGDGRMCEHSDQCLLSQQL
jgi:hypothetical protein